MHAHLPNQSNCHDVALRPVAKNVIHVATVNCQNSLLINLIESISGSRGGLVRNVICVTVAEF